jgi:glucan phosphoethanolaminetransferase (alkaline phosphatase superfamily)
MSFIKRLLVFQIIIIYSAISLYKPAQHSSDFKDNILEMLSKTNFKSSFEDIVDKFSYILFYFMVIYELVFSLIAVFGCKLFGRLLVPVLILHSIIKFNPFINGMSSEFILMIGVMLSIMISSTEPKKNVKDAKINLKEKKD